MQAVCLSERLDGFMLAFPKGMHPSVSANDGLDQTLVVRSFRYRIGFTFGRRIPRFGSPCNSDFLGGVVSVAGTSRGYQELIAGNYDTNKHCSWSIVGFSQILIRFECCENCALNFCRRDTSHRSGLGLPSTQQRRANVEAIAHAVFAGKTRAHEVAAIVVELAHQQRTAFRSRRLPAIGLGREELLDPFESRAIDDGFMLALEPFAAVMNLAEIDFGF